MKCRHCKRDGLPENSIYCCWCGKEQKRNKDDISVPKPKQLKDGTYTGRLMVSGQRVWVPPQPTEQKYYIAAKALKTQMAVVKNEPKKKTLKTACEEYYKERNAVLSPSTILGYEKITRNRFKKYMDKDIRSINYQAMVNAEATLCGAKTIKNAWGFVTSVLKSNDVEVPDISLPQIVKKEQSWLDDKQIKLFIAGFNGKPYEIGALLGLHGLRRSEILSVTPNKIKDGKIHVDGSVVIGPNGLVSKDTNKNQSSRRAVPIMIPRLTQLISESTNADDEPYVKGTGSMLQRKIDEVCAEQKLPHISIHDLRRSFVSLGYSLGWSERECMAYGGWSDYQTMHKIYIQLSADDKKDAADKMAAFYSV